MDQPPDFASWFSEEEFELCPQCQQKKAVRTDTTLVCTACGEIVLVTPP
jgi:hypothetical protein